MFLTVCFLAGIFLTLARANAWFLVPVHLLWICWGVGIVGALVKLILAVAKIVG